MKRSILRMFVVGFGLANVFNASAYDVVVDGIYYDLNTANHTANVTYERYDESTDEYISPYTGNIVLPAAISVDRVQYSVTSIGWDAFSSCNGLTSVTIPNSVTSIGLGAFRNCTSLSTVTIPNSVTNIGAGAFSGCTSLPVIDGIRYADTYLVEAVDKVNLREIRWIEGTRFIGNYAFGGCTRLATVTIPNCVTNIEDWAFSGCTCLTSVTIPNSVTSIGLDAFRNCTSLTILTLPNSVTSIGHYAFEGCSNLTSVTMPNSLTSIGNRIFNGCTSLPVIDGIRYADTFLVEAVDKKNLCKIYWKEGTRYIDYSAFYGCCNLATVTIPESVTSIGNYAFYKCSGLTSVTIPNGVKNIGHYAFSCCSGLSKVTIPNSVTSIGNSAFWGCTGLTTVTLPNSVKSFGGGSFGLCSALTEFYALMETPITDNDFFYECDLSQATLYVPVQSVALYQAAKGWKDFGTILGIGINTTDISALDYAIYAPTTEVTGKKQFALPICLKNQNPIATWQADLVLPEGFSVASDSNGNPKVTVSGSRTTASRHSVVAETLPSGAMHLLYSSSNNSEITGTDGEVATITINIAYDVEEDDYAITFKDIVMTEANETGHEQSQVVSLLTVAAEDPSRYDHNGDGKVTIEDVTLIVNYIKTHENLEIAQ